MDDDKVTRILLYFMIADILVFRKSFLPNTNSYSASRASHSEFDVGDRAKTKGDGMCVRKPDFETRRENEEQINSRIEARFKIIVY